MMTRYDLPHQAMTDSPMFSYIIKLDCLCGYDEENFYTHTLTEIYYIIDGRGHMKANQESSLISGGDLYIIPPYTKHCEFVKRNKGEGFIYYILGIENFKFVADVDCPIYLPKHISKESNIVYLFNKIFEEFCDRKVWHERAVEKYFDLLLIEIQRLYNAKIQKSPHVSNNIAAQIRDYIDVNYISNISAKTISEYFGKKLNTIQVDFKKAFGTSMQSYILFKRIEDAKKMLEGNQNMRIAECSLKTGFYNPTYFSRYFKKIIGVSPTEYKRMLTDDNLKK